MHLKQRVKQADAFQPKAILTPCFAAAADLTRVFVAQGVGVQLDAGRDCVTTPCWEDPEGKANRVSACG